MNGQLVVHAQLVDATALAQIREIIVHPGPWPQKVERRSHSFMLPPTEWRRHQDASTLNLGHDHTQPIGTLAALERGLDGAIWGTWTAWDLGLLKGGEPWYVSAEAVWKGGDADATEIRLLGAAAVRATAAVCTAPAQILVGRLGRKIDRDRWRLTGELANRIERAAQQLQQRRSDRDPIYVHDEIEARARRRQIAAENNRFTLPLPAPRPGRGQLVPPQFRPGWKPGMLEWSQAGGRVISVS
jgi:hypothetical protein